MGNLMENVKKAQQLVQVEAAKVRCATGGSRCHGQTSIQELHHPDHMLHAAAQNDHAAISPG